MSESSESVHNFNANDPCSERNECSTDLQTMDPKKILKVFIPDHEEQSQYYGDSESGYKDFPAFISYDEKHMKMAQSNAQKLSGLPVDDMIGILSDLKRRYPHSHYVDYLSRVALYMHEKTKCITPPSASHVLPYHFYTEKDLFRREMRNTNILRSTCTPVDSFASPVSLDPESKLNWWREDPSLSEHHANWHIYYPHAFDPKDARLVEARRQGELFAYMHQQMLARYNCERLAVGLAQVEPHGPGVGWDGPLPEGFNVELKDYSFRASSMNIPNVAMLQIPNNAPRKIYSAKLVTYTDKLLTAIARNYLEGPNGERVDLTMHRLGSTVEASNASVNKALYGNIHNDGHIVIGSVSDPDGRYNIKPGPMVSQYTAARDPAFFRWHKFIDDIFEEFRVRQVPHKLEDLKMRGIKIDWIKAKTNQVPTDNTLYTEMVKKIIEVYKAPSDGTKPSLVPHTREVLDHQPFHYEICVNNKSSVDMDLVFRVFLAPETYVKDLEGRRNDFIEMDRFVKRIERGQQKTIIRKSSESSVIMVPAPTPKEFEDGSYKDKGYCGCGWPENLLLPRGTPSGMRASLYVLATDWKEDGNDPNLNQSAAYCGKKDSEYPDKRPMGFPFDRPLQFNSEAVYTLNDMVSGVSNSAVAVVTIKFRE